MKLIATVIALACILMLSTGCSRKPSTLFEPLPPSHTGISFINHIEENVDFNILTYEYLYNGGGVAAGDLNNDGLADLVFSGNMVPSAIYLNKGGMTFDDITAASHFTDKPRWKTGVVMADVNGDRLTDIYLCYSGPGADTARSNQLFINTGIVNGIPQFSEQARQYGLDAPGTYTTTASFFDFDNDNDLDMFMVNHADMFYNPFYNTEKLRAKRHPQFGNRLYRNENGFFKDVSAEAGISGSGLNFGLSVSTSDINKDGWTDIYVTNDYDERDFLYLNNHNGTFREVLDKAAGHLSEFAMGSDIADYNNDNNADVVVLDMLPADNHRQKLLKGADSYDKYTTRVKHGFHHQQMRNTLQMNNGTDTAGIPLFSETGQLAGISRTDWSWAPLLADFDNDGWKDLFITNGIFKDITNLDFVKYTSGYSNNFSDKKGDKMEMWELISEMPSTRLDNYFFRNNHNLTFTDVSSAWGSGNKTISNGAAYADFDNDGDLDLAINCLNDPPFLLNNRTAENSATNFLRIRLAGAGKNTMGIGAKIFISSDSTTQYYELFTSRGFQSSVDPVLHAGLGKDSVARIVKVVWPGGKTSLLKNVRSGTLVTIDEKQATETAPLHHAPQTTMFTDITRTAGIHYEHRQNAFVDFKISPLLPFQLSKTAPCLAKADVNNDGSEDLFIGSTTTQENVLYLQTAGGSFSRSSSQPWNVNKDKTITDARFFDADSDGDQDLYLVSGGADYYSGAPNYQDEFYVNDGNGNFSRHPNALPAETASGSCVRVADYNKDGRPDLFIGNKYLYGQFPKAPPSILLINESTAGDIRFAPDRLQTDSSLHQQGMISDAIWVDINKDTWPDLVTAGLFTPISIFENHQGKLINKTAEHHLTQTQGWWCRLLADDFNNDGNIDIIAGNLGQNTFFEASASAPVSITYADFNGDQVIDPVLSFYNKGKSYPYYSLDEIVEQMPVLRKKFVRYAQYADAEMSDLFSAGQLEKASRVDITLLSSVCLTGKPGGGFRIEPLPVHAQMSMVSGIVAADVDHDGKKDVIVAGNCYPMRVQLGPLDAGIGALLRGNGNGNFSTLTYEHTGLYVPGDVRNLLSLKSTSSSSDLLVAARNNGAVQVIRIK